jgi:hypothetical protein
MLPLTLLVTQKLYNLMTADSALSQELESLNRSTGSHVPLIGSAHVYLSSATNDVGDTESRLGYPRICVYSSGFRNSQLEKFYTVSGNASTMVDIWASANLVEDTDRWIHFYVEATSILLRRSSGDWGDGVFFPGIYDVQFQSPRAGGLGFVQSARLKFDVIVNQG